MIFTSVSSFRNVVLCSILTAAAILVSSPAVLSGTNVNNNLLIRFDSGEEMDPTSNQSYPDNLVDREYFEGLLTSELFLSGLPAINRLRLGIRLQEFQPSTVDETIYGFNDERRLDKFYAQFNYNNWEIWGGDVYETFGRGLSLNLFENRDLYFDSGLRGAKVSFKSPNFRYKMIYGQSRDWYLVKEERLGGFNLEFRPIKPLTVGGNMVVQEGVNYQARYVPGVYAGYDLGPASIYVEYAQSRIDTSQDPEGLNPFNMYSDDVYRKGDGTFIGLDLYLAGIAAQINYKYYGFADDNPFQTPPTVQREYTTHLLSAHPHLPEIQDQVGFEINLSGSPTDALFLDFNFSRASSHDGKNLLPSLNEDYNPFWEIFLEGEYFAKDDLTLKFGAGWNEEAYANFWEEKVGLSGGVVYHFSRFWSADFAGEGMWVDDINNDSQHEDYWFSTTLSRASLGSLNIAYEITSLDSDEEDDNWLSTEIVLNLKRNARLLAFYGKERGGLKCSSGVCRPVQPFEGFKLTLDSRFNMKFPGK